jgi:predicted permease
MRWTKTLRLRLRSIFRFGRVEDELAEELEYHVERLVDDYVAGGMTPDEARRAARREMGGVEQRKEECRDARGLAFVNATRQDVAYALRTFRRTPAFTVVAILSLALGIGANTAIFALWNGILHAPLPVVHEPGQLVMLTNPDDSGSWTGSIEGPRSWVTYEEFEQLRDHAGHFSGMMAAQSTLNDWEVRFEGDSPEQTQGRLVSGEYFEVLGVRTALGRFFTAADDRASIPYAVISHSYWQRRFGGRTDVLGKSFTLRRASLTVVGVAPRGFIGETSGQNPDFWVPLSMQPRVLPGRDRLHDTPPDKSMWLHVYGRLKPGVTYAQAEAQANAIFLSGLESFYGAALSGERRRELLDQRLVLHSGARGGTPQRREFSLSLTALLAAVGLLLLIACANLANLLLARGTARRSEMALRLSLGASRGRLIRQLVTESLVLSVMGGVAAILVAHVLHAALVQMIAESDSDFRMTFALDPVMVSFVVAATLAAALAFGVLPALHATRTDPAVGLKEQSRAALGTRRQMRAGRLLVSFQLALSLPLLVGAGLLVRTVYNLQHADLGWPTGRLLVVRVDIREAGGEGARRAGLLRELVQVIERTPGVNATSFSQLGVFTGGESLATIAVEGYAPKGEDDRGSPLEVVGPDYFSTLGVPMTLGRGIVESDLGTGSAVCVINEAFAKRFFDRRNPIGLRITMVNEADKSSYQVVGVAKNARTQHLRGDVPPRFFVPAREQWTSTSSPTFLIRTSTEPAHVLDDVRRAIRGVDATLPITSARSIDEQMAPLIALDRTTAKLAVAFGGIALLLAGIGLYGVLSYGVARRTGEIAVRIALGAQANRVVSMILTEIVGLVAVGLILGGGLAYAATRLIGSRLYGIAPHDPSTLALATALLLAVALTATYLPARRASRVDPITALRL